MNETPYTTLPTGPVFPPTTPRIDARNWARLPPFRDLGRRRPAGSRQDGVTVQKEGDEVVGGGGSGGEGKDDLSPQQDGDIGAEAGRRGSSRVRGGGGGGGLGHLEEEEKTEMEMARLLLSKSRWKAEVMDRFVCMRWKEKCFVENFPSPSSSSSSSRKQGKRGPEWAEDGVGGSKEEGDQSSVHPHERAGPHDVGPDHAEVDSSQEEEEEDDQQQPQQQQGHGLTISGFYYIVLDRQTGGVEGLYYDPASTPFQRLKLKGCSSSPSRSRGPSSPGRGGGGSGQSARNGGGNGRGGMVWPAVGFA
ncbi:hypothetical protein KC365_g19045 [Hortaea werneckii]|nr:hypothetical protein KC342_g18986 [Hortaea werneckii]KAI7199818.1 hypothetical protein KC365_g19045 [Hortaea werneckii]